MERKMMANPFNEDMEYGEMIKIVFDDFHKQIDEYSNKDDFVDSLHHQVNELKKGIMLLVTEVEFYKEKALECARKVAAIAKIFEEAEKRKKGKDGDA